MAHERAEKVLHHHAAVQRLYEAAAELTVKVSTVLERAAELTVKVSTVLERSTSKAAVRLAEHDM